MLLDWGVHLLDQVMQLFADEKVVSVDAHLLSVFTPEVDDNIKLMVRFSGGCSVLLEMSTNCLINSPRWHVQGTDGTLQVDDWSAGGRLMRLKPNAEMKWTDDIVYTEAGPTRTMRPPRIHDGIGAAAGGCDGLGGLLPQHCGRAGRTRGADRPARTGAARDEGDRSDVRIGSRGLRKEVRNLISS